ncbi:hypothetical protein [Aeromicrobium sp. Leaf350]|uniref:hypothetical protein n=1 Tax=Aeromicrobium sp. Leaf350 TaxID=2876565 RepID=UPI001E62E4D4|nr:hypothetical protein [Aeromicrobium sp. Leaf350]
MKTRTSTRRGSRLVAAAVAALTMALLAPTSPVHAEEPNPTFSLTYDASGSTTIGAKVNASMPVGPTTLTATLDLADQRIAGGDLAIPSQVLDFSIFGIPTRATVTMTQVGEVTGTLEETAKRGDLVLTANVDYDIKISNLQARVFGIWWPLAVGSNCHTVKPVDVTVKSPAGEYFRTLRGGKVAGSYTIGSFTGCAPLNFLSIPFFFPTFGSVPINSIVPGSNNTLELQISNPRPSA